MIKAVAKKMFRSPKIKEASSGDESSKKFMPQAYLKHLKRVLFLMPNRSYSKTKQCSRFVTFHSNDPTAPFDNR
jgi:hypothetical protein